jgi:hypothetical protein
MFTIAGPVIVYGISSSFLYGLIIYIFKLYWNKTENVFYKSVLCFIFLLLPFSR